jgi:hypothetical protein
MLFCFCGTGFACACACALFWREMASELPLRLPLHGW